MPAGVTCCHICCALNARLELSWDALGRLAPVRAIERILRRRWGLELGLDRGGSRLTAPIVIEGEPVGAIACTTAGAQATALAEPERQVVQTLLEEAAGECSEYLRATAPPRRAGAWPSPACC